MIELALVRHAKSDWGDPGLADHDRPLNERGMHDAPIMAERLAATGFRPEFILTSTAVRAQATAQAFANALRVAVSPDPELYGASAAALLAVVAASGARSVAVVAHDPGMSVLAGRLSGGGIGHMPTCAVATFRWSDDDWDVVTAVDPDDWTLDTPR